MKLKNKIGYIVYLLMFLASLVSLPVPGSGHIPNGEKVDALGR